MVAFNLNDLSFILQQIKIAEAHAAGTPITELVSNPLLPAGLRTVSGQYNNIIAGRETWGSADQEFPRLTDPFTHTGSGTPAGSGFPIPVTNTNYGAVVASGPNAGQPASVVDGSPRLISNLIVDQTLDNPAALAAALRVAGSEDIAGDSAAVYAARAATGDAAAAVLAAQQALTNAQNAYNAANHPAAIAAAGDVLADAQSNLTTAETAYTAALANVTAAEAAQAATAAALSNAQSVLSAASTDLAAANAALQTLLNGQIDTPEEQALLNTYIAATLALVAAQQAIPPALIANNNALATLATQQASADSANAAVATAIAALGDANTALTTAQSQASNAQTDVNDANNALAIAQNALTNLEAQIATGPAAIAAAQQTLDNATSARDFGVVGAVDNVAEQALADALANAITAEAAALTLRNTRQTQLTDAQTSLGNAQAALDQATIDLGNNVITQEQFDAVQASYNAAVQAESEAQTALNDAETNYANAQQTTANAQSVHDNGVVGAVDTPQEQALVDAVSAAQTALNNAQDAQNAALAALPAAQAAVADRQADLNAANSNLAAANAAVAAAQADVTSAQADLDSAQTVADAAQAALAAAQAAQDTTQATLDAANALVLARTGELATAFDALNDILNTAVDTPAEEAAQAVVVAAQAVFDAAQVLFAEAEAANNAALQDLQDAQDAATTALEAIGTASQNVTVAETALGAALSAEAIAQGLVDTAQANLTIAEQDNGAAAAALSTLLGTLGISMHEDGTLDIPNVAPDEGISAPFNSWFTLFGQFFDHGLDLIEKGASSTIFIPLAPDDPLFNPDRPNENFMTVTRTLEDAKNLTTPFVDQNQTYTSHASHQVFLREYELDENGHPQATGRLLEGANGGLATWADIKAQARDLLGINLTDYDIGNVPLLATDEYGRFIRGDNGLPKVIFGAIEVEGSIASPLSIGIPGQPGSATRTGHAFLDDIAHAAVPTSRTGAALTADADTATGGSLDIPAAGEYDNELLDRHFITGDGRGNENIGLTAVHHVFHSEHNRMAAQTQDLILASARDQYNNAADSVARDKALLLLNEWLDAPVTDIPAQSDAGYAAFVAGLDWNGERVFQAARFGTEMQYQHLVFEEFGRKVNPAIDLFVFNPTMDINPAIFSEFANVVYRFGHSMLNEDVDRLGADGQTSDDIGLIEAFLNPVAFDNDGALTSDEAAGAIIRGMTRQHANEIDEFVVDALRNNLVGRPLDLAAINIARGRDTDIPPLNIARAQFFEETRSEWLKPYVSWVDFADSLKNSLSVINFIAAYGTHNSITSVSSIDDKRAAATLLVLGGNGAPADRLDFLNARGDYAGGDLGGLNKVDLWIGGLAEAILPFGGMLGSTFTFVFEKQMENLQNGDRFYYLSRTQGLNFLTELENNSFSKLIMANTDLGEVGATGLPGEIFSLPQYILESNLALQNVPDPVHDDPVLAALGDKVARNQHLTIDGVTYDTSLKFSGGEHVVINGTEQDDYLEGSLGDDTVWGKGGDDLIVGGHGINRLHGGDDDDIVIGGGDPEFIHGDGGNDVMQGGGGLGDLIFGGTGSDFVISGIDGKEVFAGEGNDFILGTPDVDFLLGGEGDDWIEGGEGFDGIAGDNSELFFNSPIIGHDVMFAGTNENDFDSESGDDIMVQGESVMRSEGMLGFDWVSYQGLVTASSASLTGVVSDMNVQIFTNVAADILRNRFDRVEGVSGSDGNDTIIGESRTNAVGPTDPGAPPPEATFGGDELNAAGARRINGLAEVLGIDVTGMSDDAIAWTGGNVLLGGAGSDIIQGNGGNDVIDGDSRLNVRIGIKDANGNEIGTAYKMQGAVDFYTAAEAAAKGPGYAAASAALLARQGSPLDEFMFDRSINPAQLSIVREIVTTAENNFGQTNVDVAVFRGNRAEYEITSNPDGSYTVAHVNPVGPALDDGIDRVRNVELLRFADVTLDPSTLSNTGTTGQLALSIANGPIIPFNLTNRLETGDVITVSLGTVADPDGLPAFDGAGIVWQVADLNPDGTIAGWVDVIDPDTNLPFTGLTFSITDQVAGSPVRAVWNFVDNGGNNSTASSAATANVLGPDGNLPVPNDPVVDLGVDEDNAITITRADLLPGVDANPVGEAIDFLNFVVRTRDGDPVQGTLSGLITDANGFVSIVFTPTQDFNGGVTIEFDVVDAGGNTAPAELVVEVNPVNDAPVINVAPIIATIPAGVGGSVLITEAQLFGIPPFGANPVDANGRAIDVDGDRLAIDPASVALAPGSAGTLVDNQDGTWTYTAAGGVANTSVTLNFAVGDGTVEIPGSTTVALVNVAPTGTPVISDLTPTEGQTLSLATAGIVDANGIGALSVQWQSAPNVAGSPGTFTNIPGATNVNFTPGAAQVGLFVKAVVTYTDGGGTVEILSSTPTTRVVGDAINSNAATVTGTAGDDVFTVPTTLGLTPVTNNTMNGLAGNDTMTAGRGNDTVNAGDGDDTIVWGVTNAVPIIAPTGFNDGRDIVNGGLEDGIGDTFVINGNNQAETYRVYARADWLAVAGNAPAMLQTGTEIVITRNGTNNASVIAELNDIEEIVINTGAGADTVLAIGNFSPTNLLPNTITVNAGEGNDTVDIRGLTSSHRVVLNTGGGTDQLLGERDQDEVNIEGSTGGGGSGGGTGGGGNSVINPTSTFTLTQSDLDGLKALINGNPNADDDLVIGVRDPSGRGNDLINTRDGSADIAFLRLTKAHYGEADGFGNRAINPIFADLDARNISNILAAQEADAPKNAAGANIFFMAFGQYFDHGLDFLPKGGNGTIQIGGPGMSIAGDNPADLTRGTVSSINAKGVPIHMNKTSAFVDQNQAYGSHILVQQFLRESDGNRGLGSNLLTGGPDPMAPDYDLLPTLGAAIMHHWQNNTIFTKADGSTVSFRSAAPGLVKDGVIDLAKAKALSDNFLGSKQSLLLDTNPGVSILDHIVAGDGRANENVALTAMHTVWARNHNFHVKNLEEAGFDGTSEELFQAARMLNEAEYQRVVFTEFADALIGGMRGVGDHGFKEYSQPAEAGISHEFAAAVYRVGHSLISNTLTVKDANGDDMEVRLVDAFLNPGGYQSMGVGNILGGIATQQAEEVDFNIVDAVRNDLVGIRADLAAFNIARGWDVGLGTLNQVRADLKASKNAYVKESVGYAGDLSPYTSWDDFQLRNGLSNAVIDQFKAAYPDLVLDTPQKLNAFKAANPDIKLVNGNTVKGIDRVDLWVGGLAEKHINGGQVGQTFWVVLHEQFDRLQEADRFYYIERFDNFDLYENEFQDIGMAGIIARNTGLTSLPEDIFFVPEVADQEENNASARVASVVPTVDEVDALATASIAAADSPAETPDSSGSVSDALVRNGTTGDDVFVGSIADEHMVGNGGNDVMSGGGGNDMIVTANGNDVLDGGTGDDLLIAGGGQDTMFGGTGQDQMLGGEGNDTIVGGTGDDIAFGDAGDDTFIAAANDSNDRYDGGAGNDTLDMSAIISNIEANLGTGLNERGYARNAGSSDVLQGIENIVTGAGNDKIIASGAVNVMDGGAGQDTFVFRSATDANGDTIVNFEPGDRIDLTGFMGSSVTLVNGAPSIGQVSVTHEQINGEDVTVLRGNTDADDVMEFTLNIKGHHNLTGTNFV